MRFSTFTRALLCGTVFIAGASAARADEATDLDVITVTIDKVKKALNDAVGGISVTTRKEMERDASQTVSDVLDPMPGVATDQNPDDPATAVNIRGLQDFGRVAVTIDGARQNFQRSGHNANGMFYFEPEMMQQVTVTRGPIANVYGSGAIGGVVSFDTIDALSFLHADENAAIQQRFRYGTNGDSLLSSTIAAVRLGEYGGLLGNIIVRDNGSYKDGNGDRVYNTNRDIIAGLVKGTLTPGNGQRIDISYIKNHDTFKNGTTTVYDNTVDADTLAAKYNWDGNGNPYFNLTASAYWTSTEQSQEAIVSGNTRDFNIDTYGTDVYNTSRFETGWLKHTFTVGADVFQDKVKVVDPAGTADLFTPSGKRTVGGAFVQDQVDITKWLEITGAGRFDTYELEGGGTDSSGSRFSPKAMAVLKPFEDTSLAGLKFYGSYAEGYRAPAITETLISGMHPPPAVFYFVPNPDLKPEVGHNLEAGLTGSFSNLFTDDTLTMRASVYRNNVSDYIGGVYNPVLNEYQYQNIAKARLYGIEGEVAYDAGVFFAGIAGSMVRGKNRTDSDWLDTVPADKLVTTVGFRAFDQKATFGARWFAVAKQDRVPAGSPTSEAYNVVNLFSNYNYNENLQLGFNVDNIFDENYRAYLDSSNSPGRTFLFTLTTRLGG
ncbi:TonB-dependent receptor domain-containing protein [Aestuariivirga sp.]|uniref:TonB-dependent receptor domain-containing protein n=1 Tax=Aestuariivirga sp. TaxID=2650926 RepID=UPI0039E4BC39